MSAALCNASLFVHNVRVQGYKWRSKAAEFSGSLSKNRTHPVVHPPDPCSHWYPGSRPFESPEVNSIANWITTLPNLAAFFDLRNFGQMSESFFHPHTFSKNPQIFLPREFPRPTRTPAHQHRVTLKTKLKLLLDRPRLFPLHMGHLTKSVNCARRCILHLGTFWIGCM